MRDGSRNVKNWQGGTLVERWTAASLLDRENNFCAINGCEHMNVLLIALENYTKPETEAASINMVNTSDRSSTKIN